MMAGRSFNSWLGYNLLVKSMTGKGIARELVNVISVEYGISFWQQCTTECVIIQ